MRGPSPSLNIAPSTVRYVTQEEFERKADLHKAKYRNLVCVLVIHFIVMLICFSVSLSYTYFAPSDVSQSGFSCAFRSSWDTEGVIKYKKEDQKNRKTMHDDRFNLEKGTFTAKAKGIYNVFYYSNEDPARNVLYPWVSLLINNNKKSGNQERNFVLELDKEDKVSLKCTNCKNTTSIQQLYFCVAVTFIP